MQSCEFQKLEISSFPLAYAVILQLKVTRIVADQKAISLIAYAEEMADTENKTPQEWPRGVTIPFAFAQRRPPNSRSIIMNRLMKSR